MDSSDTFVFREGSDAIPKMTFKVVGHKLVRRAPLHRVFTRCVAIGNPHFPRPVRRFFPPALLLPGILLFLSHTAFKSPTRLDSPQRESLVPDQRATGWRFGAACMGILFDIHALSGETLAAVQPQAPHICGLHFLQTSQASPPLNRKPF